MQVTLMITLLTVQEGQCRFPLWDENEHHNFRVCGKETNGGSYCEHHAKICFAPAPPRRKPIDAEAA